MEGPAARDIDTLKRQMTGRKFDGAIAIDVVRRCRWGYPQVVLCRPLVGGRPFPTTFWLSCPHLDRLCALREASGGVRELEDSLKDDYGAWVDYHIQHVSLRLGLLGAVRSRLLFRYHRRLWRALQAGGVGGIRLRERITVKCLHLQVASWLALGRHPGSPWLAREIAPLDCPCPGAFPCGVGK